MTFTKCNERGIMHSVGWCEAKPTQLKSPGRFSSFPFPHLSPLKSAPGSSLFQHARFAGFQHAPASPGCVLRSFLSFSLSQVIEGMHELGGRIYAVHVHVGGDVEEDVGVVED